MLQWRTVIRKSIPQCNIWQVSVLYFNVLIRKYTVLSTVTIDTVAGSGPLIEINSNSNFDNFSPGVFKIYIEYMVIS